MAEAKKITFVLTDKSLNSSGFWVDTDGGDLKQFLKNPVMLWMHMRSWRGTNDEVLPIGKWENVQKTDDGRLTAEAVFDENDQFAVKIKNKVDGGFIRMASVGIRVLETSSAPEFLKKGQTRETITKWQLVEASVCDIGRNDNALAFYDKDDNLLTFSAENEADCPVKLLETENSKQDDTKFLDKKMKKLTTLFSLAEDATENDVVDSAQALMNERNALAKEKAEREEQLKAERKTEAETLTDAAIKDGRINDDKDHAPRKTWLSFFERDFDGAKAALESIPTRKSVKEQMENEEFSQPKESAWVKRQKEIEDSTKN